MLRILLFLLSVIVQKIVKEERDVYQTPLHVIAVHEMITTIELVIRIILYKYCVCLY